MAIHTLQEIRNSIMRLVGVDVNDTDNQDIFNIFINHTYADVCASFDWDWMRVESGFNTVPTQASGTISGSGTAITGSGTSFDSSNVGSYIMLGNLGKESHLITAVTSPTALTVRESISNTCDSGSTYLVFKPDYTLSDQIDPSTIKFAADTNKSLRLEYQPEILLERYFVNEGSIAKADTPRYWSVIGATGGYPILRLFPIPDQAKYIKFVAMRAVTELVTGNDSPIIPVRYQEVIEHGALALAFNWHGKPDMGKYWKDEYEATLKQMIQADNLRATYSFPREPNDLPKPRLRKFVLRLPGSFGGNILE